MGKLFEVAGAYYHLAAVLFIFIEKRKVMVAVEVVDSSHDNVFLALEVVKDNRA